MKKINLFYLLLLLAAFSLPQTVSAVQDDEKAINEVVTKLGKALDENDLKSAAELMTQEAVDETCGNAFLLALQFSTQDLGDPDLSDTLSEIVETNELDKVELPEALTNPESMEFPTVEEMSELRKEILKVIPVEKRVALATEILEATSEIMMGDNSFAGEVIELEIKDDNASATIELDELEMEGMEDIEIGGMRSFLKFKKVDDQWMLSGYDEEKTEEYFSEMMGDFSEDDVDDE